MSKKRTSRKGRDWLDVATGDPERDRKIKDTKLCLRLLAGYSVDDGAIGFPKTGSEAEWLARAALARSVREGVRGFTGEFLALAIDPRKPSNWPGMRPIRTISFDKPRGRQRTWGRDLLVINFIRKRLRDLKKEDAALRAAEIEFKLKKSRVHEIWSERLKIPSAK
jgi:hypothetical protein